MAHDDLSEVKPTKNGRGHGKKNRAVAAVRRRRALVMKAQGWLNEEIGKASQAPPAQNAT